MPDPTPRPRKLPPFPPEIFGDTGEWVVSQHTETLTLRNGGTLVLQTSDEQTDDGKRGVWVAMLSSGGQKSQTSFEWCPLAEAREKAVAWVRESIAATLAALG
jgi:hypothetical protein